MIFLAKIDLINVLPQFNEYLRIPYGVYQEIKGQAASLGIGVIGTIGVILMAKKRGYIEKPVAYLKKLKETGFRISDDLYQHAIRLAGK